MVGMSLLDEIQAAATDPSHSLSDMLRKCQILAFRLRHEPFKSWVNHELNGYPAGVTVPSYRTGYHGAMKAQLAGPFGSSANNVEVPTTIFPESIRDEVNAFTFNQGVAALESLVVDSRSAGHSSIMTPFPVEIAAGITLWQGYQTLRIWTELPIATVISILDQVRSRALEFTLEIEAENPDAGASGGSEPPVPLPRADAIFNTVILGGQVAVGPGAAVNVTQGDLGSLMRYLETLGVEIADRNALEEALRADKDKLGPRVKTWLGEMAIKATASGGRIAEAAAGGAIAVAIGRYLGLA
jgi:hypothetical protein